LSQSEHAINRHNVISIVICMVSTAELAAWTEHQIPTNAQHIASRRCRNRTRFSRV